MVVAAERLAQVAQPPRQALVAPPHPAEPLPPAASPEPGSPPVGVQARQAPLARSAGSATNSGGASTAGGATGGGWQSGSGGLSAAGGASAKDGGPPAGSGGTGTGGSAAGGTTGTGVSTDVCPKPQAQACYYVSPSGSDTNDGTVGAPFQTITKARDVVSTVNTNMTGDIYVYLRGGDYRITSPITFAVKDSGTGTHRIYYQAYPGETPVINGAQRSRGGP